MLTETSICARVHGAVERANVEIRRKRRPNKINGRVEFGKGGDWRIEKDNMADTSRNKRKERYVRCGEREKEKGSIFKGSPRNTRNTRRKKNRSSKKTVHSRKETERE